jgi:hypothetical protein
MSIRNATSALLLRVSQRVLNLEQKVVTLESIQAYKRIETLERQMEYLIGNMQDTVEAMNAEAKDLN